MTNNVDGNITQEKIQKNITLYDLIEVYQDNKKKIIFFTISVGLITAFFLYFIIDPVFLSTSTVKTTSKSSGLENLVSQSVPGLGDFSDLGSSSSVIKELSLYENILNSRRCIEETIIKFKLNDEWGFRFMQDAVKNFRENVVDIKKDKIAGTMEINVYDKIPERAKEIANFLIYELNKINIELNVQKARTNREFIEERYKSLRVDLKNAEDSLKVYQDINGIVPDVRLKAIATAEIQLETEIKSEEVKLDLLHKVVGSQEPEVKLQEEKVSSLKKQLNDVLNSTDKTSSLRLKGAPEILINYARNLREVELQNKLLAYIMPLYEQAKIEEKKEMPSVIIIDQPDLPERKAKPKRVVNIILSLLLSFTGSYTLLLILKIIKINFKIAINNTNKNNI
jgi:tyrosine-protein kinase Etk/Wzc